MAFKATERGPKGGVYLEPLKMIPFVSDATLEAAAGRDDAVMLTLSARGKAYKFEAQLLRTHLSMAELERWIGKAKAQPKSRPLVLLAPYVSRPMGERLREAGVAYVDQVGNMYIALPPGRPTREGLVAFVEGKRSLPVERADAAWRAPSYQVLFALLVQGDLIDATVRTIAARADVSTTPVLHVQKKLLRDGMAVAPHGHLQWTPRGQQRARELWLHGYHTTLRPSLLVGRFRPRVPLATEALELELQRALGARAPMRWGGAAAAYRLDRYYRGDRTVLHTDDDSLSIAALAGMLRMIPDPQGPVVVLRLPGRAALESPDPSTVHPLLAWAELLEEGNDRASEAAEHLAASLLGGRDAHK